jgi:outer membrane protein assembly factor BamB
VRRVLLMTWIAGIGVAVLSTRVAAVDSGELVYSTEGNRLHRIDVDSIGRVPQFEDVLIRNASEGETGGSGPVGRDVNGMICALPDGSSRFLLGEDTGQPAIPPGWGVFEADGIQVGKLAATGFTPQPEPFGCAFDGQLLFTTEVGDPFQSNGQLILWFPPFDHFPGEPDPFPNADFSPNYCKISEDIGAASGVAVDESGRVLVASPRAGVVYRFSPPFPTAPDAGGGCGRTDPLGSPLADLDRVNREIFIQHASVATPTGIARAPSGDWYVSSVLTGNIAEFDSAGSYVRTVVQPAVPVEVGGLPASTGHPQSLAVDAEGSLYYADLDLRGSLLAPDTGPNGSVRRVRFSASGVPMPPEVVRQGLSFPDGVAIFPGDLPPTEWRTLGGSARRLYFNPDETQLTTRNADQLATIWQAQAGAIVTASPSVAAVELPGEGLTQMVYFPSWDEKVYAVRLSDGSPVWTFTAANQPGASYPAAASVTVSELDGTDRVFVGVGETMYSLDAVTGQEIWHFTAGTGCVDGLGMPPGLCGFTSERNQIESSAIVVAGTAYFGMDIDDVPTGKGGFFAVDARTGHLTWFFDLESGSTCHPDPGDQVMHFDGYHSETELGLPPGFSLTRAGCDFDRTTTGCGNVWSSPAYDESRGLLYTVSSNCDTDEVPGTPVPPPPMPPYDEAIFALDLDGNAVWRWRPREVDNNDLSFGAVPNLFTIETESGPVEVLGVGGKDGTYYVIDRDGINEQNGVRWDDADPSGLPYWSTNVVAGGPLGGIIASAAADEGARRIYFSTAPGFDPLNPQRPTMHALDMDTGAIVWENGSQGTLDNDASFSPTTGVPGLAFTGAVQYPYLRAFDAATGELRFGQGIGSLRLGSAIASGATVVDGILLVGTGIGARSSDPNDPSDQVSRFPSPVVALRVPVPEPSAGALALGAFAALGYCRKRRQTARRRRARRAAR